MSRLPDRTATRRELFYGAVAAGGLLVLGASVGTLQDRASSEAVRGYGGPPFGDCGFGE